MSRAVVARVVGGGGAARAVVRALAVAGAAEVVVVNRSAEAAAVAAELAPGRGRVGAGRRPAGVRHRRQRHAPRDGRAARRRAARAAGLLHPGQIVVDLVYNPLETPVAGGGAGARHRGPQRAQHARVPGGAGVWPLDRRGGAGRRHAPSGARGGVTGKFPGGSLNFVGEMPTKDSSQDRSPEAKTVALQGTLDTFALPDVLRLLATTRKTGRLRVNGDRGSGSLWVEEGQLAASELIVPGATDDSLINTLFHLLRFKRGSFIFESGAMAPAGMVPNEIEPMLDEAETMLVEWRSIEAVVPSVDAWLTLRPELAGSMVKIDNERWRIIAAIGGGRSVGGVGEALGLDELPALRGVKEIVELGLVSVGTRAPSDSRNRSRRRRLDEALASPVAEALPPIGEPVEIRSQWDVPREIERAVHRSTGLPGLGRTDHRVGRARRPDTPISRTTWPDRARPR